MTLLTIGLPVFNGENYLEEALASIAAQTFTDFRVHISDNGSTDRTAEMAANWAAKDARFCHDRLEENCGAAENFNRILRKCETPYFRWHAHDDVMHPDLLQVCVDGMRADDTLVGCTTKSSFIGPQGEHIGADIPDLSILEATPSQRMGHWLLRHSRCDAIFGLYRTDILQQTVQIPSCRGGDQITLCELSILGPRLEVPRPLLLLRQHSDRVTAESASDEEIAKWFDPTATLPKGSARARLLREKLAMVRAQDLSFSEALRCRLILYYWYLRQTVIWPLKGFVKRIFAGVGLRRSS